MIDLRDQLQAALGNAYSLERELGGGGMSRVFVATDLRLRRAVVVKVLAPELAAGISVERFAREIRLAAALQEPHIVPVLTDGATAGGMPYYTMPYVRGESLRARLRAGPMSHSEAISTLRDVALALSYAHAQGVVHRDIKPENILLHEGTAVVTDFGIAKALSASRVQAASEVSGTALTDVGSALGTPAYMAPEQAAGEDVDARADLYAWGVVAYELLANSHPFPGTRSARQLITAHLTEKPKALSELAPSVSRALGALVMATLEKEPADRPATAAVLLAGLEGAASLSLTPMRSSRAPSGVSARTARRLAAALLAIVVLGGAGAMAWRGFRPPHLEDVTEASVRRLAVLPFENLGRPEDAYVVDGLTEEIRGKLASVPGLQVTPRASATQYAGTRKTPQVIAAELGVRYLLTGTVRSEPGASGRPARVRVLPELIEIVGDSAAVGRWQQSFNANATDVFAMEADIAGLVATAMDVTLGEGVQRMLGAAPTTNLAAYDAYLRGEQISRGMTLQEPVKLRQAATYYEQAAGLDPRFTLAWARLSLARSLLYGLGEQTTADSAGAGNAAVRAVALSPESAEAHHALGRFEVLVRRDLVRARAAFEAGLQRDPRHSALLSAIAMTEMALGRWPAALSYVQRSVAVDARSVDATRRLGFTLRFLRRYPEAQGVLDQSLALAPSNLLVREERMLVDLARGELQDARAVLRAAPRELDPAAIVVFMAAYQHDLVWVLDDVQQQLLLRQSPIPFDNDRGLWGLALAGTHWLRGNRSLARSYADSARLAIASQVAAAPDDAFLHTQYGLALAYLGLKEDAIREGTRAVALEPITRNGFNGPYMQHQLVRILLLLDERERALDLLEPLLRVPYDLSPGWLRIDPSFAPLQGHPRFERLVRGRPTSR